MPLVLCRRPYQREREARSRTESSDLLSFIFSANYSTRPNFYLASKEIDGTSSIDFLFDKKKKKRADLPPWNIKEKETDRGNTSWKNELLQGDYDLGAPPTTSYLSGSGSW